MILAVGDEATQGCPFPVSFLSHPQASLASAMGPRHCPPPRQLCPGYPRMWATGSLAVGSPECPVSLPQHHWLQDRCPAPCNPHAWVRRPGCAPRPAPTALRLGSWGCSLGGAGIPNPGSHHPRPPGTAGPRASWQIGKRKSLSPADMAPCASHFPWAVMGAAGAR